MNNDIPRPDPTIMTPDEMRKLDIDRDNPLQVFFADNLTSTLPLEYERLEK